MKNNYISLIISSIALFLVIFYAYDDFKVAYTSALFIIGMYIFNYNIVIVYNVLKKNKLKTKELEKAANWIYILITTILIIIIFIFILPRYALLIAFVMSAVLLGILLIYDLIKSGVKKL